MNKTKIPWAEYTWNPITGCSPASVGCAHCYAREISRRFHWPWGRARLHPERLGEPARRRAGAYVFVCSMGDIFHESVSPAMWAQVRRAMEAAPQHTYMLLTKRPENIPEIDFQWPFNWWLGVTAENQARYEERWLRLTALAAGPMRPPVRFLSVEPMLGPVVLRRDWVAPDWVIAGPENGRGARPCRDEWIRDLAQQSAWFFDKRPQGWERREMPAAPGGFWRPQADSPPRD